MTPEDHPNSARINHDPEVEAIFNRHGMVVNTNGSISDKLVMERSRLIQIDLIKHHMPRMSPEDRRRAEGTLARLYAKGLGKEA